MPKDLIALFDIVVVFLCAWGMAAILAPVIAEPRTVECQIEYFSADGFTTVQHAGKGVVWE